MRAARCSRSRTRRTRACPTGTSEADNPVLHTWGDKPTFAFAPKPHWEVGEALGILDFEAGAKIAGARFTVLRGAASRLTRGAHQLHARSARRRPATTRSGRRRSCVARRCAAPASCRSSRQDLFKLAIPSGPITSPTTICSCRRPPRSRSRTSTPITSSSRASCRAATARTRRASAPRPAPTARTRAA